MVLADRTVSYFQCVQICVKGICLEFRLDEEDSETRVKCWALCFSYIRQLKSKPGTVGCSCKSMMVGIGASVLLVFFYFCFLLIKHANNAITPAFLQALSLCII